MVLLSHKRTENSSLNTIKAENMFSLQTSSCLQKPLPIHKFYTFSLFSIKKYFLALAGVAQWIEHWPANQRVTGSISRQGTCLGCGPGPQ